MCVSLRGGLIRCSVQPHKGQTFQPACHSVFIPTPKFCGNQIPSQGVKKQFMCQQEQVYPVHIFIPIHLDSWPGQNPMPYLQDTCSQAGPYGTSLLHPLLQAMSLMVSACWGSPVSSSLPSSLLQSLTLVFLFWFIDGQPCHKWNIKQLNRAIIIILQWKSLKFYIDFLKRDTEK